MYKSIIKSKNLNSDQTKLDFYEKEDEEKKNYNGLLFLPF